MEFERHRVLVFFMLPWLGPRIMVSSFSVCRGTENSACIRTHSSFLVYLLQNKYQFPYVANVPEMPFMALLVIYSFLHKGKHNHFLGSHFLIFICSFITEANVPKSQSLFLSGFWRSVLCLWDSLLLSRAAGKIIFIARRSPHQ